jgi:hypothetical protein
VSNRPVVHLALIHWPVYDLKMRLVCTNVTNFDIHDIARASRTYGIEKYFIVNRMKEQLSFVSRVLDHWRVGTGSAYNPTRRTALSCVELKETFEDLLASYEEKPLVVCTSGKDLQIPRVTFREFRDRLAQDPPARPVLLIFGTGNGLADSVLQQADLILEPIQSRSPDGFRFLSVRSAVSIVLDRLLGTW